MPADTTQANEVWVLLTMDFLSLSMSSKVVEWDILKQRLSSVGATTDINFIMKVILHICHVARVEVFGTVNLQSSLM